LKKVLKRKQLSIVPTVKTILLSVFFLGGLFEIGGEQSSDWIANDGENKQTGHLFWIGHTMEGMLWKSCYRFALFGPHVGLQSLYDR
jgi:hypothetical protein